MDFQLVISADGDNPDVGDIKLDEDGQIQLTPDLKSAVAQHIAIRLRTFFGEWFLDAREGVPYFELILVKNPDLPRIENIFRTVILETPGVSNIDRLLLAHDAATRILSISDLRIILDSGATLTGADFGALIVYRSDNDGV
jgi:hypothetical protein